MKTENPTATQCHKEVVAVKSIISFGFPGSFLYKSASTTHESRDKPLISNAGCPKSWIS